MLVIVAIDFILVALVDCMWPLVFRMCVHYVALPVVLIGLGAIAGADLQHIYYLYILF